MLYPDLKFNLLFKSHDQHEVSEFACGGLALDS